MILLLKECSMKHKTFRNLKFAGMVLLGALLASCGVKTETTSDVAQPTATQAARILTQGTFGASIKDINRIQTIGTGAWFNDQFSKPQTMHFGYVNQTLSTWPAGTTIDDSAFIQSFWKQAITGDDQLRQRVTFALSQIFVISFQNDTLATMPRGVASYYDMLGAHAFGNYRELLEAVTRHPMMGIYLSALRNQKTVGARVPDENYAREVMQLFTIGLRQLNPDGSDTTTPPTATYTNDDIKGLAKVFTGWCWAGPDTSNNRFNASATATNPAYVDPNRDWLPMQNYSQYHELLQKNNPSDPLEIPKSVLLSDTVHGVLIPDNTSGEDSLKIALDTLFYHPNVGPFIGRQLIQRLVTDNPSPAYISRVAAAFNNNGKGVRGDLKAVIKAILLDSEAIDPTSSPTYNANNVGKLREPVLRLANWMRAFGATSSSGQFLVGRTDDPLRSLSQTVMRSPSVFNFYRPEYQAPNTTLTSANLFAPEMQITDETSVFGYLALMRSAVANGVGSGNDIKADYSAELALAATPDLLLDRINLLLMQNNMSTALRTQILAAINSNPNNSAANKVYLAVYLTLVSPEYITQK
jgi:uncharacterized protein (DUF1800 family)